MVSFSIAINESFKRKGDSEITKQTKYVDCSYWISTAVAKVLRKGAIVELCGNLTARAYNTMSGEAKAVLNCHVNHVKVHGGVKGEGVISQPEAGANTEPLDDLPF